MQKHTLHTPTHTLLHAFKHTTTHTHAPQTPKHQTPENTAPLFFQVVTPAPGGAADLAGIKPGDIIAAIDGKPTKGLSLYEAADLLQGAEGTQVGCAVVVCGGVWCGGLGWGGCDYVVLCGVGCGGVGCV